MITRLILFYLSEVVLDENSHFRRYRYAGT